jgi:hypothetical protein
MALWRNTTARAESLSHQPRKPHDGESLSIVLAETGPPPGWGNGWGRHRWARLLPDQRERVWAIYLDAQPQVRRHGA